MDINEITYAINGDFKHPKAQIKRMVLDLPEGHDD